MSWMFWCFSKRFYFSPYNEKVDVKNWSAIRVDLSGFAGGHSGLNIHEERANAIKIWALCLSELIQSDHEFRLAELKGGNARNAIPSHVNSIIYVKNTDKADIVKKLKQEFFQLEREYKVAESVTEKTWKIDIEDTRLKTEKIPDIYSRP
eukprot:UN30129